MDALRALLRASVLYCFTLFFTTVQTGDIVQQDVFFGNAGRAKKFPRAVFPHKENEARCR
jgi:hypothetical protein